ncbi:MULTISPECIES: baseplate J/gp47 family protein [unclassified Lysinibacillus]|uniref:baseplate assembly protein n=1 Tax=unclassified Lysinibacillus TaxID=2636778 RepID=UPI0038004A1F
MSRFELPDVYFLDKAPEQIESEILFHVREKTGLTLQRADPRLKFIQAFAAFVSIERNKLEHGLRQNRLSYAEDDILDHMGVEMSTERLPAKYAKTTMAFVLEEDRVDVLPISSGTRYQVGDVYFVTDENHVIPTGTHLFSVEATCSEPGEIGNGFLVGEISTLVEPLPYVKSVQNTTITSGGADEETDDAYAERIRLAPESFSVAGPEGAYIYWTKAASQNIIDVKVKSPVPGEVAIYILMANGRLPSEEDLALVESKLMDEQTRPLTDKVSINAPSIVNYSVAVEYWIANKSSTVSTIIEKQVNQAFDAYLEWQRSKLGRDVDFSELIARLKQAGAARVSVSTPMFIEIEDTEVAVELSAEITFKGLTND